MKSVTLTDPKSGEQFEVQLYGTTPAVLSQIIPILKEWKDPNHVFKQMYAFLKSSSPEEVERMLEKVWDDNKVKREERDLALPLIKRLLTSGVASPEDERNVSAALGFSYDPMIVLENFGLAVKVMSIVVKKESLPSSIQLDDSFWNEYEEMDGVMNVANYFRNRIAEWTSGNK